MTRRVFLTALGSLVALSSVPLTVGPALGNGGKGKRVVYRGVLRDGTGQSVELDAELEPLMFRLTAARSKYRVVRVRLRNIGTRPLALSAAADVVEAHFRTGPALRGLLDLGARDAEAWDALPAELRGDIAYPQQVEAGEEESVFVFLPVAGVSDVPVEFRYTIASRPDRPVIVRDVSTAVRH